MKVLVTGPDLNSGSGGQVTHLKNIRSCFSESENVHVDLFYTSAGLHDKEGAFKKILRTFLSFILFFYKALKYDVVHINTTLDNRSSCRDLLYGILSIVLRKKLVLQIHGGDIDRVTVFKFSLIKSLYKYVLKKSCNVLVLTKSQLNNIEKTFLVSAKLIRNYIPMPELPAKRKDVSGHFKILFLSRLENLKGIFELIEACAKLKSNGVLIELHIAGDGPHIQECRDLVNTLDVLDIVIFHGFVEGEEKRRLYLQSNIMALPSYAEGLPYSVLEALSYGVPVLVTPVGALPDILNDKEEAVFVDIKSIDSIVTRINEVLNGDVLLKMSDFALSRAQQFSFEAMEREFNQLWSPGLKN